VAAGPEVPEPPLAPEEQEAFDRGVAQFNAGLFYECHDTLEEVWSGLRGPSRDFLQGLIQVAVGFYHLGNENLVGAERLWSRALKRLEGYPAGYGGLDLGALRTSVEEWRRLLHEGRLLEGEAPRVPPRLRPVPARSE
jgi:predicted metal-dependent hydrolase